MLSITNWYPVPSFKVKIAKADTVGATITRRNNGFFEDVWVGAPASLVASTGECGRRLQWEDFRVWHENHTLEMPGDEQ